MSGEWRYVMHPCVRAALEQSSVQFIEHRHADYARPIHTAPDFAAALGYAPERIAKTLLLRGETPPRHVLAVCPSPDRLDLAALARLVGWRRAQFASTTELETLTGYPRTGVSPLGVAGVPVLLEQALLALETVLVGGGAVGVEIELAPGDLLRLTAGTVAPLVVAAPPRAESGVE